MVDNLNQNPEQKARDEIDKQLEQAGWKVQDKNKVDFKAGVVCFAQKQRKQCYHDS